MRNVALFLAVFVAIIIIGAGFFFLGHKQEGQAIDLNETHEPSSCSDIAEGMERDECYFLKAGESKNSSLCLEISNNWKRGDCLRLFEE